MKNLYSSSRLTLAAVALFVLSFLVACSGGQATPAGDAAATEAPVIAANTGIVAEGRIVPQDSVDLAFVTAGTAAEVLVKEGDAVKKGDVLARLGNQEELEAGIARAEQEVVDSQRALDDLDKNYLTQKADALRAVADANKLVRDAKYNLDNFTVASNQDDMEPLEAVKVMEDRLDAARDAFEPYRTRSSNDSRRRDLKESLDDAQADYNSAVRRLELTVELDTAEARLQKANDDYEALGEGPRAEDIASAKARLASAEASLTSAKAALENLELTSPIDGTVIDVNLLVGEEVKPNTPVFSVADFSQWYVETDDLTEIDVVNVTSGQQVEIVPDALPDLTLTGTVDTISQKYEEKRGDITYTVKILLQDVDPRLRWGMTVATTFNEE